MIFPAPITRETYVLVMVNVKVVNANALLAGKVIIASAHHNQQSTAWIQRARFAVEEENVYVESVSAQIQEALAVSVNIAQADFPEWNNGKKY